MTNFLKIFFSGRCRDSLRRCMYLVVLLMTASAESSADDKVDLALRDVEISAAMEMLSRREQANIVLEEGVTGTISVNLYQVDIPTAIRTIANSGGFEVERRGKTYHVIKREDVNRHSSSSHVALKTFKLKYADPTEMLDIVQQYLSGYGDVVVLAERNMLVVEDTPEFLSRISTLIDELDYQPKQVLIEAKILEVRLDDQDSLGVEWSKLLGRGLEGDDVFTGPGTDGAFGTQGLANAGGAGFFAQLGNDNIAALLDALETTGQARTLSTPTLLTLENEPAEVIVGNRLGYINTVTINQVTTETTEFLESGVILEVTPSVGRDGNILLDVHPEVSTGTVAEGIPSQDTTSVRTQLIVPDGATSFIGGLMRMQTFDDHRGIPILGKIPLAGRLFSRQEDRNIKTEIIVLITPRIVDPADIGWQQRELEAIQSNSELLENNLEQEGLVIIPP